MPDLAELPATETQDLVLWCDRLNLVESGKRFKAWYHEPGIVNYLDVKGGDVELIRAETIDEALPSIIGCPLTIGHIDVTTNDFEGLSNGTVDKAYYDADKKWYCCEGTVDTDTAREKIKAGWGISVGTRLNKKDFDNSGGSWHNIPFGREIKQFKYHHLALVDPKDKPRFEDAEIRLNSKLLTKSSDPLTAGSVPPVPAVDTSTSRPADVVAPVVSELPVQPDAVATVDTGAINGDRSSAVKAYFGEGVREQPTEDGKWSVWRENARIGTVMKTDKGYECTRNNAFDESKHPRASDGKFGVKDLYGKKKEAEAVKQLPAGRTMTDDLIKDHIEASGDLYEMAEHLSAEDLKKAAEIMESSPLQLKTALKIRKDYEREEQRNNQTGKSMFKWIKKALAGGQPTEQTSDLAPDTLLDIGEGKTVSLKEAVAVARNNSHHMLGRMDSIEHEGQRYNVGELVDGYRNYCVMCKEGRMNAIAEAPLPKEEDKAKEEEARVNAQKAEEEKERLAEEARVNARKKLLGQESFRALAGAAQKAAVAPVARSRSGSTADRVARGKQLFGSN